MELNDKQIEEIDYLIHKHMWEHANPKTPEEYFRCDDRCRQNDLKLAIHKVMEEGNDES
jgi:hypothetical protein